MNPKLKKPPPKPVQSVNNLFAHQQKKMIERVDSTERQQTVDNDQNNNFIRQIVNKNIEKFENNLLNLVVRIKIF